MSNELYDVFLDGVAEGRDKEQAKQAFAQLFRLELERAEHIFSQPRSVLKSNIDAATADKYIARLEIIGIVASKSSKATTASPVSELSLQPIDTGSNTAAIDASTAGAASAIPSSYIPPSYIPPSYIPPSSTPPFRTYEPDHPSVSSRRIAFKFSGRGFEYFKIWIVNILLSIITLGIYSAWAKVRNKQYFYGNTELDNASFEYTAEPLKILKGRIIAVVFFILYSVVGKLSPLLAIAFALLMLVFIPWIIVSSLKFNARHSSYRNINFRFVGSIWGAAKAFILWPLAAVFSLGILFPVAWKRQATYITSNHLYGSEAFGFDVSVKQYYKVLLVLLGASILLFAAMTVAFGASMMGMMGQSPTVAMAKMVGLIPVFLVYMAFYFLAGAYFIVSMANIHYNNTHLRQHRFAATWSTWSYALLLFTNTLGIVLTLGLFIPFARVRSAAYKAEHTELVASGDLESFIAAEREQSNALGEGVHDIFDIDISL